MRPRYFYAGLALITMATLMLQIIETRLLSVTTFYYLAFLSISMAMFGMTAGAVWVYLRGERFTRATLSDDLAQFSCAFAASTALSLLLQLSRPAVVEPTLTSILVWLELTLLLAAPFFFSGIVVALALTRSPLPVARVYAVDLVGAAVGCLGVLVVLELTDAPSAVLALAAATAFGAWCFTRSGIGETTARRGWLGRMARPLPLAIGLAVLALANSATLHGLRPLVVKGAIDWLDSRLLHEQWNSFSRVQARGPRTSLPYLWGPSPLYPRELRNEEISLTIDGDAGTIMQRYDGRSDPRSYLQYDLTNLAYYARNRGRAAVIGVGGGRDLLSAHAFGFRDITGVELNPIFVRLLTDPRRFRNFAALADLPGLRLITDEGRSWFSRSTDRFDLIQMSLIDTWAATGAGAFTLSENGLYTVEAWTIFLQRLHPEGLYTVSRWYGGDGANETGRTTSLAVAALLELGAAAPAQHVFVAATDQLANTIVSPTPLSPATLDILHATAARLQFTVLASPRQTPASPVLARLVSARSRAELAAVSEGLPLDLSPPTDDRPFFFNQLRLAYAPGLLYARVFESGSIGVAGVVSGNLHATLSLFLLLTISLGLVLVTIVFPLRHAVRRSPPRLAIAGTLYFLCLGLAFMFVEMAFLQRLSIFLGHPIYALAIVLFSLILATGAGSYLSDRLPLASGTMLLAWAAVLGGYLLVLPIWLDPAVAALNASGIAVRATLTFLAILPAGLLMGVGFPTGMRLVNRIDTRPTPWFWGVNGAGGVLAATLAVLCSMHLGINATLATGAVLYLVLGCAGVLLTAAVDTRATATT